MGGSGDRQERTGGRDNPKDVADRGRRDSAVNWADTIGTVDRDGPAEPRVLALQRADED